MCTARTHAGVVCSWPSVPDRLKAVALERPEALEQPEWRRWACVPDAGAGIAVAASEKCCGGLSVAMIPTSYTLGAECKRPRQ